MINYYIIYSLDSIRTECKKQAWDLLKSLGCGDEEIKEALIDGGKLKERNKGKFNGKNIQVFVS